MARAPSRLTSLASLTQINPNLVYMVVLTHEDQQLFFLVVVTLGHLIETAVAYQHRVNNPDYSGLLVWSFRPREWTGQESLRTVFLRYRDFHEGS